MAFCMGMDIQVSICLCCTTLHVGASRTCLSSQECEGRRLRLRLRLQAGAHPTILKRVLEGLGLKRVVECSPTKSSRDLSLRRQSPILRSPEAARKAGALWRSLLALVFVLVLPSGKNSKRCPMRCHCFTKDPE